MRRSVAWIGTAALTVVLLTAVSPPAAAALTVVRGHDYNIRQGWDVAGLAYWSAACSDPGVAAAGDVYALARRGGATGSHAIGFGFSGRGNEAGLLAYVDDPASLSTFDAAVHSGGSGTGHAHAYLYRDGADFKGWYVGTIGLDAGLNTWGSWGNLADEEFGWRFQYEDGTWADYSESGTISALATVDASVTYGRVGLLLGCGREDYYVDDLRVRTGSGLSTYDFEELGASRSHVSVWHPKRKRVIRDARSWRLKYGGRVWIAGDATLRRTGEYFWDTGTLYQKKYGSSRWRPVLPRHRAFSTTGYAWWRVEPTRRTAYQFRTDGNASGRSTSADLVVQVRAKVTARAERQTVRVGDRIPITGRYLPRTPGIKVTVQRRTSGGWRDLASSRTTRRGTFSVRPRATSAGTWTLRVAAATGKGNLGNKTGRISIRVRPRPEPPPPTGCQVGCTATTSPPDPVPITYPTPAPDYGLLPEARRTTARPESLRQASGPTGPTVAPPPTITVEQVSR